MKPYKLVCYGCNSVFEDLYPKYYCEICRQIKYNTDRAKGIKQDLKSGIKQTEIAMKYGVTKQYVSILKKQLTTNERGED